jgi:hypothetical protein
MANVRFQGTYEFEERDTCKWMNDRPQPRGFTEMPWDRYELRLIVKGEVEFEIGDLKDKISIDVYERFACQSDVATLRRDVVQQFKGGKVDKMIKEMIIKAINRFKFDKDCNLAEKEYEELISGVRKYGIEFTMKPKDLQ